MAKKKRSSDASRPSTSAPETQLAAYNWSKIDRVFLGILISISSLVYLYTMWPSLAGGDSGELTAAAYTLGIVHPPGYPLYVMLAHAMTYLPFGNVAYRVNLLSVLCTVATLGLWYGVLLRITQRYWMAFGITGLLAFSSLIWRYAILAEVFSLNNLFVALLFWGWTLALQSKDFRHIYWMGFVFGLGLCNHHTLLFTGVPIGLHMLFTFREKLLKPLPFLLLFFISIAGLLPYSYLFWASAKNPLIAWGDITSWNGFLTHFFRQEYGTFKLATEGSDKFQLFWGLYFFLINAFQIFGYLGGVFIAAGVYVIYKRKNLKLGNVAIVWFLMPTFYLIVFHWLANLPFVEGASLYKDIVSRFWLMPNLQITILFSIGYLWLEEKFSAEQRAWLKWVFLVAPFIALTFHFSTENHRNNTTVSDFGRYLLEHLPPNAIFFSLGDINTNSIRYVQNCEGVRPDVKILDRSLMSYPWFKRISYAHYPNVVLPGLAYHPTQKGAYDFKRLFDANIDRAPIFMSMIKAKDSLESIDKAWEKDYMITPYGLTFKVTPKSEMIDLNAYARESAQFLVDPLTALKYKPLPDSWDAVIQGNLWLAHHLRAAEILKYALKSNDKTQFEVAEKLLEDLLINNPAPAPDYYKNLGIAHQHLGQMTSGEEKKRHDSRMLEVWETYIAKTDRRDKTFEDIKSVLRAYGRLK